MSDRDFPVNETVIYRKQCTHKATASGPRLILIEDGHPFVAAPDFVDRVVLHVDYVRMACDECNTPWAQTVVSR